MKRFIIGIIIITLCLSLGPLAGVGSAGWPDANSASEGCSVKKFSCCKAQKHIGTMSVKMCWNVRNSACAPCKSRHELDRECNEKFKNCGNRCRLTVKCGTFEQW